MFQLFRKKPKKVGLALGGGAARGLAHIGVLEVLQREGIPIDMIAGSSAGALFGALYAQEKDAALIKRQVLELDWKKLTSLIDLTVPRSGFVGGRRITALLAKYIGGDVQFNELKLPLACVATDVFTGEEIVIKEGSVLEAVRASISIPVIFKLFRHKDRYMIDGGLSNPVPVSVVKEMGADFIIAVNVIPSASEAVPHVDKKTGLVKEPGIFTVIMSTTYMLSHLLAETCSAGADVIIRPHVAHIGPLEFHRARECILMGQLAAQSAVPEIKRLLGLKNKEAPAAE